MLGVYLGCFQAEADVRVYVEQNDSKAWIRYHCTSGESVRAFPLDVTVDRGRILGVSDFFRGACTDTAQGYGIFPASFRDHITIEPGAKVIHWTTPDYTPLALVEDDPAGTQPGLGSSGVTLEFGALWNPAEPATRPGPQGTLCALEISEGATVTVSANTSRGGVVAADPDRILALVFEGAFVQPPEVTGLSVSNDLLTITFAGGELETAPSVEGPWTGTGNSAGEHVGAVGNGISMFYRVRGP